jgi:hypothetical protein
MCRRSARSLGRWNRSAYRLEDQEASSVDEGKNSINSLLYLIKETLLADNLILPDHTADHFTKSPARINHSSRSHDFSEADTKPHHSN